MVISLTLRRERAQCWVEIAGYRTHSMSLINATGRSPILALVPRDAAVLVRDQFHYSIGAWSCVNCALDMETRTGVGQSLKVSDPGSASRHYGQLPGYANGAPYLITWWQKTGAGAWTAQSSVVRHSYYLPEHLVLAVFTVSVDGGDEVYIDDVQIRRMRDLEYAAYGDELLQKNCGGVDARDHQDDTQLALIPNTMAALRNGGVVRFLLMGDSFRWYLSTTPWEALLMRRFPGSRVLPMSAVIGSTGAEGWNDSELIADGVASYEPTIVAFGGISSVWPPQTAEWEGVISKLRVAIPGVEIILGSCANGLNDTSAAVSAIAAVNGCAFFDESQSILNYAADAGTTIPDMINPPAGDGVHFGAEGMTAMCRNFASFFGRI